MCLCIKELRRLDFSVKETKRLVLALITSPYRHYRRHATLFRKKTYHVIIDLVASEHSQRVQRMDLNIEILIGAENVKVLFT